MFYDSIYPEKYCTRTGPVLRDQLPGLEIRLPSIRVKASDDAPRVSGHHMKEHIISDLYGLA
jgi:hypothetical protein